MGEMTSRERFYAAANFSEPDRIPICFGTSFTSILECPPKGRTCTKLYDYLGLRDADPVEISEAFNLVVNLDERLLERLHSDVREVGPKLPKAIINKDGTKTWPALFGLRIKKIGYYDDVYDFPMKHMTTKKDIDEYRDWPSFDNPDMDIMEGVLERAKYLSKETNYFVVGLNLYEMWPFNGYAYLSSMEKWLTDIKIRPKFYHQLAEKFLEITLASNKKFYGSVGKFLDGAVVYDDLGTQSGPMMSHKDFLNFYKPYLGEIISDIRRYIRPTAKIIIHSCGSVHYAIQDLIDIGVDILNPVQPLAHNMEPCRLKRDFRDRIAFLGGFDIQRLLPKGNVHEIRKGAKKLMQEYAAGGGYIFAMSHNIEPDIPSENIVAAFDAAYEYGKYPIISSDEPGYVEFIRSLNY